MKWFWIFIPVLVILVGCEPSHNGNEPEVRRIYLGGVNGNELGIYSFEPSTGKLKHVENLDLNVTGRLTISDDGVLVPSSGVIYKIDGDGVEEILEGDDVFKLACSIDGTVVGVGEEKLYMDGTALSLKVEEVQIGDGYLYLLANGNLVKMDLDSLELKTVLEGDFETLSYDPPYLYLTRSSTLYTYMVSDPGSPTFESEMRIEGVGDIKRIITSNGDILMAGDGGIVLLTTSEEIYSVYNGYVSDFDISNNVLFLVSDLEDVMKVLDISIPSEVEILDQIGGLNLSNPSVLVGEE